MASSVAFSVNSSTIISEIHAGQNTIGWTARGSCSCSSFKTTTKATLTMAPNYAPTLIPSVPTAAAPKSKLPKSLTTRYNEDEETSTSSSRIHPSGRALADEWRDIQGAGDWRGLIDPLHPLLRAEILRYGEMVNACYKAFDMDPKSKRYLNCKYSRQALLKETFVGVPPGYEVTKYIYAAAPDAVGGIVGGLKPSASGSCSSRWIGYVAVSTDAETRRLGRRDVMVAFRGTVTQAEWAANFMSAMTPAQLDPHDPRLDVKVEAGFLGLYTCSSSDESRFGHGSCREQLLGEIARIFDRYGGEQEEISVTLTGHSMGSSLALLLAYDLAELGLLNQWHRGKPPVPVTVFSFAGPRVGNLGFRRRCEELGVKVLRVVNVNDPVTKLPGMFVNETTQDSQRSNGFRLPLAGAGPRDCYAHVGVEVALEFFNLKDPASVHDLGHYLSLLRSSAIKKPVAAAKQRKGHVIKKLMDAVAHSLIKFDATYWTDAAINTGIMAQSLGF